MRGRRSDRTRDVRRPAGARAYSLTLRLGEPDVQELAATHPGAEPISASGGVIGASVPVADLQEADLQNWLGRSRAHRAPARLAPDAPRASSAVDLPKLPTPAQRALAAIGVTTLDDVCGRSRAEFLELHGMGPQAIRLLQEGIDGAGLRWE